MLQTIKNLLNVPKEVSKLCHDLDCAAKKTVETVKANGVALERVKKK